MKLSTVKSIRKIDYLYETGDRPVQVACSDKNTYICKYMQSTNRAYKLVSELIGVLTAKAWNLSMPGYAFVDISDEHWEGCNVSHVLSAPAFGCKKLPEVTDINNMTFMQVASDEIVMRQLLGIALYDMWIANEDRTYNNANLLYDVNEKQLISIDYGGIFNMATYGYPLSLLTLQDSILYSESFTHLSKNIESDKLLQIGLSMRPYYLSSLRKCKMNIREGLLQIPSEWNMPHDVVERKVQELFKEEWTERVWLNFIDCLKESINTNQYE